MTDLAKKKLKWYLELLGNCLFFWLMIPLYGIAVFVTGLVRHIQSYPKVDESPYVDNDAGFLSKKEEYEDIPDDEQY